MGARRRRPGGRALSDQLPEAVAAAAIDLTTGPLVDDPHRIGRPLRNELPGLHAARRGTYRILCRIDEGRRAVVILDVRHRRDAYR